MRLVAILLAGMLLLCSWSDVAQDTSAVETLAEMEIPVSSESAVVKRIEPQSLTRGETPDRTPEEELRDLCVEHSVDYALAEAIIWTESRWQPDVLGYNTNGTHDVGRFQLNSACWTDIAMLIGRSNWDPYNPRDNLRVGVEYLAYWTRYWAALGFTGPERTNLVISSYSVPSDTMAGEINWEYITRIRQRLER